MASESSSRWARVAASPAIPAALIAAFAVLCFFTIRRFGSWFDESYTLLLVGPHGYADIARRTAVDGHPPLWYWVLKPWLQAFGTTVYVARWQSVVFMLVAFGSWFHFVKTRFSRGLALVVLALMVTNPMLLHYAIEGRMYAFAMMLVGITSLLVTGQWRWRWVAYWPCAVAMLYTHYFLAFVIASHFLYLLLREERRSVPWLLLYGASIIAAFAPWLPSAAHQTSAVVAGGFWIPPVSPATFLGYVEGTFLHRGEGDLQSVRVFPALGFLALWVLSLVRARRLSGSQYTFLWCVVVVPWVFLFVLSCKPLVPVFHPRYVIFGLPALLTLLAAGALAARGRWRAVTIAALIAGQVWGISMLRWRGYTDVRGYYSMKQIAAEVRKPIDGEVPMVVANWQFGFFDARVMLPASQRVVIVRDEKPRPDSTDALYYDRPDLYVLSLDEVHAHHVWLIEDAGRGEQTLPPGWRVERTAAYGYARLRLVTVTAPTP